MSIQVPLVPHTSAGQLSTQHKVMCEAENREVPELAEPQGPVKRVLRAEQRGRRGARGDSSPDAFHVESLTDTRRTPLV